MLLKLLGGLFNALPEIVFDCGDKLLRGISTHAAVLVDAMFVVKSNRFVTGEPDCPVVMPVNKFVVEAKGVVVILPRVVCGAIGVENIVRTFFQYCSNSVVRTSSMSEAISAAGDSPGSYASPAWPRFLMDS